MKLNFIAILLRSVILLLLFSPIAVAESGPKRLPPPYKISKMTVMTYNHFKDELSKDISDRKDIDFWNNMYLSLLATIEISGKPGYSGVGRRVEVTAYEGKKMILKKEIKIGLIYKPTEKYYIPVWVYGHSVNL